MAIKKSHIKKRFLHEHKNIHAEIFILMEMLYFFTP